MAENEEKIEIQENVVDAIQETAIVPTENTQIAVVEDVAPEQANQPQESAEIPMEITFVQENYSEGEPYPQDFPYNPQESFNSQEQYNPEEQQNFIEQDFPQEQEEYTEKKSRKKVKVVKKLNIEKNQRAIKRNRRNKIIGRALACLFVVIFIGSIVGMTAGAYSALDKIWWENVGEEAGVEFKELFTLFNGVTDSNEDKIVTNGYGESDLTDFYSNLKRKMFLAQDYELSISQIISSVMSATQNGEQGSQGSVDDVTFYTTGVDGYDLQYLYCDARGNIITGNVKPTAEEIEEPSDDLGEKDENKEFTTGNAELDKLLQEIKFDFSPLADYDGQPSILEIPDKQLAAVINDAFSALATAFKDMEELQQTIGKPLDELLQVKQVIISGNEIDSLSTNLKITLSVKVKELLSNILKQYGIPSIVNSILPEMLYASVRVYPYDVTKPIEASINRLEEEKVNKIVRIVDVILRKTGQTTSISDMLVQVNSKVVEVLDEAQQKLPIALVPSGSVDLYPIESLMGMLDVDVSEQAFLYMLKDIKLPTGESLGLIMPTPEKIREYTNVFVSEVSEKYCLDNSDGKISADNTIKDVMNFASSESAIEAIRLRDFDYSYGYSQQLKVRTSYEALAGMLSDYVKGEGLLGDIQADIVEMSYLAQGEILSIDIRVNVAGMLGYDDDSIMSSLIRQLVPQYIYVSANICVNSNKNTPTTIEINKTGAENSKVHLQTLTTLADRFGMDTSSLTYDGICEKIDGGLQDGLAQMQEKIGCEIIFTPECAYLPNLFEVVCGTGLIDEDENNHIEPERLYAIMKQAYTFDVAVEDRNKSKNANAFIGELESKYYLQKGKIVDDGDGKLLQKVMGLKDTFGTAIDKSALANDDSAFDKISPLMTAGEFAYLMELNIDVDNMSEALKSAEVLGAKINDDEVLLYLQASLYELSAEGENADDMSKYANFMPEYAYIILTIDTVKVKDENETSVKICLDGMEDDAAQDFFSIVRKLTGKSVGIEEIEGKVDVEVKDYISRINGIDYNFESWASLNSEEEEFKNGAMVIDNIFNVIAGSDIVKSDDPTEHVFTSEEIRRLLQDMYGYDYDAISGGAVTPPQNLDHFIDVELYNKYFISDTFRESLKAFEKDDALLDGFAAIGGKAFSVNNIRLSDLTSSKNETDIEGKSQKQIEEEIALNFKPEFTSQEIAHLLRTQVAVAGDMSFLTDQEVVYANNDEYSMTLTLRGKGNMEDENAKGLMPDNFYITVTIDLGSILANGSRSDMNVHALDINSVKYVENGGENQDLQLLLMLIDRIQSNTQEPDESEEEPISLDGIMEQIENNLNGYEENGVFKEGFKDKIHNKIFTVSFLANGGFIFNQTIYQIALNSIYEVPANDYTKQGDMPQEIDFRNGLCKANNMPDKYEYSQGVFLDFANGNRAESASNSIGEINDKYALAKPLQEGATAILSMLGNYAKDYAMSIDGKKLTSEQKRAMSIEELRPHIDGEELLLLLEDSVAFEADGYEDAEMSALYILDGEMIIVYKSPVTIDESNQKFADLLPKTMAIVVNIDVNAIDDENKLCTKIGINDLKVSEVNAIQSMVKKLNENENNDSQSLEEANEECSESVRKTMQSLTNNMHVSYVADETVNGVTGGGVMILDSIYEVASQKINDIDSEGKVLTAQEVKDTLEALFDGLDINADTPPSGLSEEQMKVTYTRASSQEKSSNLFLDTSSITTGKINIHGAIGGWNIGAMIDADRLLKPLGLEESAKDSENPLSIKHTLLMPTKTNGNSTFDSIRDALNYKEQTPILLDGKEYFIITLDMDMIAATGEAMSILPERMDLTLCMDLKSEDIAIKYNAMTSQQCNILSRLVKTSRSEGVSGLDLSNTDAVKSEIMDMEIIKEQEGTYTVSITLGRLLKSGGEVLPISKVREQVVKDENVILGMGAMIINYNASI